MHIGHVHLTISNLDTSLTFYRDLLGFKVTQYYGKSAVFLSDKDYHHHIGLNTWNGEGVTPPPTGHSGLYHFAILFDTRKELARTLKRLIEANYPITGYADHGVSEAIYLNDPDGIGVELYVDRPKVEWPVNNDGEMEMITKELDIEDLLAQA